MLEHWTSFSKEIINVIERQLSLILKQEKDPVTVRVMHDRYAVLKRVERKAPSLQQYEDIRFIEEEEVASEPWYYPVASKYGQEENTSDEDYHNDHWIIGQNGYLRDILRLGYAYKVYPLFRMYLTNPRYHPDEDSYCFSIPATIIEHIRKLEDTPRKRDRLMHSLIKDITEIVALYTIGHKHNVNRIE